MNGWNMAGWLLALIGGLGLVHSYVTYPLWWWLRGPRKNTESSPPDHAATKKVTVIVAAYNEAEHIAARIKNLLASDYPMERLEILIASDGSSDQTVELAEEAAGGATNVRILCFDERRGKISVLNDACEDATGEILVFSDANVEFAPSAIQELVSALEPATVGCACGRLVFRSPTGAAHEQSEGLYWKLETWLKTKEGQEGALLGANGAIYALKAKLWTPCPSNTLVDDFYIPMRLLMDGHQVVYAPDAVAEEDLPPKLEDEFGRRIRIGAGNYQALFRCWKLLHPRNGLAAWVFFSHKVLRWAGPFLMMALLIGSLILALGSELAGIIALVAQGLLYGFAALGLAKLPLPRLGTKLAGVAVHFVAMNVALLMGFFRWIVGTQRVTWNRTRR